MSQAHIEVIQHHAEGGIVESKLKQGNEWTVDRAPKWNFEERHYRKQPRVFYILINKRKNIVMTTRDKTDPRAVKLVESGCEIIEAIEQVK